MKGNYLKTRESFRAALEIEPFRPLVLIGLGMSYLKLGESA